MAGGFRKGRQSRIHNVRTGFHSFQQGHGSHAAGAVGVDVHRNADFFFQSIHQRSAGIRCQEAGHIFDADGVSPHFHQFLGQLQIVAVFMVRADGIHQGALGMGAGSFGGLHGRFQVPGIVESIEDTDDVDTVVHAPFYEFRHHIICIVVVAQDVLATEQHL